jgi:hypothetical protein
MSEFLQIDELELRLQNLKEETEAKKAAPNDRVEKERIRRSLALQYEGCVPIRIANLSIAFYVNRASLLVFTCIFFLLIDFFRLKNVIYLFLFNFILQRVD